MNESKVGDIVTLPNRPNRWYQVIEKSEDGEFVLVELNRKKAIAKMVELNRLSDLCDQALGRSPMA